MGELKTLHCATAATEEASAEDSEESEARRLGDGGGRGREAEVVDRDALGGTSGAGAGGGSAEPSLPGEPESGVGSPADVTDRIAEGLGRDRSCVAAIGRGASCENDVEVGVSGRSGGGKSTAAGGVGADVGRSDHVTEVEVFLVGGLAPEFTGIGEGDRRVCVRACVLQRDAHGGCAGGAC